MPKVRPFTGLMYDARAGAPEDLTSPPYDTVSPSQRRELEARSPYNIVRVILPDERPSDAGSGTRYARAGDLLKAWRRDGVLTPTAAPAVYPYEMSFAFGGAKRRIRGLIAEVDLEPWNGGIVPHERTLAGPIEDRLALLRAASVNLSPIYVVLVAPCPDLARFLDAVMSRPADRTVGDEDGTRHRLWIGGEGFDAVADSLRSRTLLIADGHHRYAVALAYREEMRRLHGAGPWDAMMMFIVDAATEDPPVLPFHRVVRSAMQDAARWTDGERADDLAGVLARIRDDAVTFGLVRRDAGRVVHEVRHLSGAPPTVCALHERVLDRVPGLELAFVPDPAAAEHAVATGAAASAYVLPATTVRRVWDVVRTSRRLPEKSTYFWPKPRTGLVMRPLER